MRPLEIIVSPVTGILLVFALIAATATGVAAGAVEIGYRDFEYGGTVISGPTAEKPESKVWWNDGLWWGSMWNDATGRYEIYELSLGNHRWTSTGTAVDDRPASLGDALWDGQKLYVVSHIYSKDAAPADTTLEAARLYRFDYSAGTYTLDAGFPVLVNNSVSESLVLAKDSSGKLWVTWTEDGDVLLNRSTIDDATWGTPFVLPAQDGSARDDDISSIVSFAGDRIGVLWSDQSDDRVYFSVHHDGNGDTDWESKETALVDPGGESIADDHVNLATCDRTGRVFAAVKTGMPNPEDPEIVLLKRELGGTWSNATWSTDADDHTRPIVVVNGETNTGYIFASATLTGNQEVIFMKATNLDEMVFPPGKGLAVIESIEDEDLNNVTSTKQAITAESGLLVLASDKDSEAYLHNFFDFDPIAKPRVFSAVPGMALVDDEITIMGAGFTEATSVKFDGDPASFTVVSNAEIRAQVPAAAQIGKVRVTTPYGSAASVDDFVVIRVPTIASVSPTDGPVETEVQIDGLHLSGVTSVTVGGVECESITVVSDLEIRATVPDGATTGAIRVSNLAGSETAATDFVVIQPPVIASFTPTTGQAGYVVVISGSGFTGTTSVSFAGTVAAGFNVVSDAVLAAAVAPNTTTGPITVTNAAASATSAGDFAFVQVTGADLASIPGEFGLEQNRPNPFRPHTEIRYQIAREARVRMTVYDVIGRRVRTLVDGSRPAGRHAVRWDGRDASGRWVASGVYFYELRAGDFVGRRMMTLRR